jgi:phage gp36-like protein
MAYSTQADELKQISEAELIQLTDDAGAGVINDEIDVKAGSDADEEIDSYLRKRYSLPLDPIPSRLNKLSVDIRIYNLYGRRQRTPEDVRTRYKDAISFLKDVADGKASLGEDTPGTPAGTPVSITSADRKFSRSKLHEF